MLVCSTRLYGPYESRPIPSKPTIIYLAYSMAPGIYSRYSTNIWMNAWHSRSSLTSECWASGQEACLPPAGISSVHYGRNAGQMPNLSSPDSDASPGQLMADCQLASSTWGGLLATFPSSLWITALAGSTGPPHLADVSQGEDWLGQLKLRPNNRL